APGQAHGTPGARLLWLVVSVKTADRSGSAPLGPYDGVVLFSGRARRSIQVLLAALTRVWASGPARPLCSRAFSSSQGATVSWRLCRPRWSAADGAWHRRCARPVGTSVVALSGQRRASGAAFAP